jgi:ribokinase
MKTVHPIVVIGSSNLDLIVKVDRLPLPGETVGGGVFTRAFGGKGANQAVAAARSGGRVQFIACLGDDEPGASMLRQFSADQINTQGIVIDPSAATGTAVILVDAQGRNSIAVAPGANAQLSPAHLQQHAEAIRQAPMVVLQLEVPSETVRCAIDMTAAASVPVLLNYAPALPDAVSIQSRIDYLVVNETEAALLLGREDQQIDSIEDAAAAAEQLSRRVNSQRQATIILTLGRLGVVVHSKAFVGHIPALSVQAVDTTAAGDTFCGSLATALVQGQPIASAVRFASTAAALSVTRLGAQTSIPTRAEIDARIIL